MRFMILLMMFFTLAGAAAADEAEIRLDKGIAATLAMPEGDGPHPAVIMLHGLGSSRNEVGNLFADAAEALADRGIASLRIDFRGFGQSAGDTGAFTLERQNADALIALEALRGIEGVDPGRIGVMGFSFGGGAAIELGAAMPEAVRSVVLWSSIGDYRVQMLESLGQGAFDRAQQDGIVGLDLGWRTMALKREFFDGLARHDLFAALARYPGALLVVNGAGDDYRRFTDRMIESAAGTDKQALAIEGADHVYHVYTPSKSKVPELIEATLARFAATL